MERETGIEPATNSLEGCDSTTELLPHFRSTTLRNGGEGRTRTFEAARATDLQSAASDRFATSPNLFVSVESFLSRVPAARKHSSLELAKGFEPPTG